MVVRSGDYCCPVFALASRPIGVGRSAGHQVACSFSIDHCLGNRGFGHHNPPVACSIFVLYYESVCSLRNYLYDGVVCYLLYPQSGPCQTYFGAADRKDQNNSHLWVHDLHGHRIFSYFEDVHLVFYNRAVEVLVLCSCTVGRRGFLVSMVIRRGYPTVYHCISIEIYPANRVQQFLYSCVQDQSLCVAVQLVWEFPWG